MPVSTPNSMAMHPDFLIKVKSSSSTVSTRVVHTHWIGNFFSINNVQNFLARGRLRPHVKSRKQTSLNPHFAAYSISWTMFSGERHQLFLYASLSKQKSHW